MSIVHGLSRKLHDTFELPAQAKDEVPIFPHERAVVTKTFSYRKEGFSYGCRVTGVRGLSCDKSFIVIRGKPIFVFLL
jgi:hypothetical protein